MVQKILRDDQWNRIEAMLAGKAFMVPVGVVRPEDGDESLPLGVKRVSLYV